MHEIMIIYLKELRDTIRDRRTLLAMVLIPMLLTPGLIVGMSKLEKNSANSTITIAVAGASNAPTVIALLKQQPHVSLLTKSDPQAAVKNKDVDAGLVIAPQFSTQITAGQSGKITIYQDSTQLSSSRAVEAITTALTKYSGAVVLDRLKARQINPALLTPVNQSTQDVASKQALAGFILSLIVPMFLLIYSMSGGMYTAMDVSAGEKERFTMEALLLSPATKLQITLGKLFAVSTTAVATIILSLASLFTAMTLFPLSSDTTGSTFSLSLSSLLMIGLLGILLALSFSALELALGVFARSFKEAQNYITPLYILAVIPTVALSSIPTLKPGPGFFLIPTINTVLVFKESLVGTTDLGHILMTIVTMLLFCVVCVAVTLRIFSDERVLLRS